MMKTKIGILYCVGNTSWNEYKKCGRTVQTINKRVSNMQTSLLENCFVIYTTYALLDTYFYEYLLKKILKKYRVRKDREFFDVNDEEIKMIFNFFNELNTIFDTKEKLILYIQNQHPEYLKKRKCIKSEFSSSENPKQNKRKGLFVDTSY